MPAGNNDADPWASASWEGAESTTLAVGARMTIAERLEWLEEATRMARLLRTSTGSAEDRTEVADTPTPIHRPLS